MPEVSFQNPTTWADLYLRTAVEKPGTRRQKVNETREINQLQLAELKCRDLWGGTHSSDIAPSIGRIVSIKECTRLGT
jgi:hypothetical protein